MHTWALKKSLRLQWIGCLVAALSLTGLDAALADDVWLKNGNYLSGKIINLDQGKLELLTSFAGRIVIDWSSVVRIRTDESITILSVDGRRLEGTATSSAAGNLMVETVGEPTVLGLAEVAAINPKTILGFKTDGSVKLSLDFEKGNTDKEKIGIDVRARVERDKNRLLANLGVSIERTAGITTSDKTYLFAEYNRIFSERWYGVISGVATRDEFKALNFRGALGTGPGYQVFQSSRTELSLEFGPSYVYQIGKVTGVDHWAASRLKISIAYWVWPRRVQFFHDSWIFGDLEGANRHFLSAQTGINVPIIAGFGITLQYDWNWDNKPQPPEQENDNRFRLMVGYSW